MMKRDKFDLVVLVFMWILGLVLAAAIGAACVGCGPAFTAADETDGDEEVLILQTGVAVYPSPSVVVPKPLPPRSTRPAPLSTRPAASEVRP